MASDNIRILLVDDADDQQLILRMLLDEIPNMSCTLEWYKTYQDGFDHLMHESYDVALIDYQLGERRTGIDLVREAVLAGCTIPLILLTAQEEQAVDVAAMHAGAADYLGKSELSVRILERAIRYTRERQRTLNALTQERTLLAQRVEERTAELWIANVNLARALRLQGAFLASMSHELRTPLSSILGFSDALREGGYGEITSKQRTVLHTIMEQGTLLLALINGILDLAKIGAGKIELLFEPIEVSAIAHLSLRAVSQEASRKPIEVRTSIDPQLGILQADAQRLTQILANLLSNAVKFTPAGGLIGLDIVGDAVEHVIHYTVWDTGIGISEADQELIFKPFVQLDHTLGRHYPGTGLGLALVIQLVELHHGRISVTSVLGQGSRFTVSLPWNKIPDSHRSYT